jgi:hypothetical protein
MADGMLSMLLNAIGDDDDDDDGLSRQSAHGDPALLDCGYSTDVRFISFARMETKHLTSTSKYPLVR